MKLRIEQSKDVQMISLLNEPVQQWHHQHYPELFKAFHPTDVGAALREILNQPSAYAWVALMDEKPVGYALCIQQYRTEMHFSMLQLGFNWIRLGFFPNTNSVELAVRFCIPSKYGVLLRTSIGSNLPTGI